MDFGDALLQQDSIQLILTTEAMEPLRHFHIPGCLVPVRKCARVSDVVACRMCGACLIGCLVAESRLHTDNVDLLKSSQSAYI